MCFCCQNAGEPEAAAGEENHETPPQRGGGGPRRGGRGGRGGGGPPRSDRDDTGRMQRTDVIQSSTLSTYFIIVLPKHMIKFGVFTM